MGAASRADSNGTESNETELAPELNYTTATRLLAERQLASCAREITTADLKADMAAGLSDAAVERLLGGTATSFNLSAQDQEDYDKAIRGDTVRKESPSILGVQVHNIPLWLQLVYMIAVVAAISYVVMLAVRKLMA